MHTCKYFLLLKMGLLCMLLLPLGGCWNNKDINHRSLPIILGLSMTNNNFNVLLDIPDIEIQQGQMQVVKSSGNTISQIIDKISMNMESEVDLLHLKVIVIDKRYAKIGLKESISSFMRSREISAKTIVVVCDEDLDTFFNNLNSYSQNKETTLYNYFQKNAGWNPQTTDTRVWQIFRSINSYTHDFVAPLIKSGDTTAIEILGSAVFKNGKMVNQIDPDETLLLNAFNNTTAQGKIEVMNHATVQIISNSISHKSSVKDGVPYLNSKMKLKVTILDTKGNPSPGQIKDELQTLVQRRSEELFRKIQKDKADIMGIGQFFRTKLSREQLSQWREEYYPRLQVKITVQTDIQDTGNLRTME